MTILYSCWTSSCKEKSHTGIIDLSKEFTGRFPLDALRAYEEKKFQETNAMVLEAYRHELRGWFSIPKRFEEVGGLIQRIRRPRTRNLKVS